MALTLDRILGQTRDLYTKAKAAADELGTLQEARLSGPALVAVALDRANATTGQLQDLRAAMNVDVDRDPTFTQDFERVKKAYLNGTYRSVPTAATLGRLLWGDMRQVWFEHALRYGVKGTFPLVALALFEAVEENTRRPADVEDAFPGTVDDLPAHERRLVQLRGTVRGCRADAVRQRAEVVAALSKLDEVLRLLPDA